MIWPYGKHKGKQISTVPTSYLRWVVAQSHTQGTLFKGDLLSKVVLEISGRARAEQDDASKN